MLFPRGLIISNTSNERELVGCGACVRIKRETVQSYNHSFFLICIHSYFNKALRNSMMNKSITFKTASYPDNELKIIEVAKVSVCFRARYLRRGAALSSEPHGWAHPL